MNARFAARILTVLLLASLLSGCAQLPAALQVTALPSLRESQASGEQLRQYEQKRDLALFQAAQARLEQGDEQGCRTLLNQLLGRSPKHLEGRLLLADLQLAQHDAAAAQTTLAEVLAEHPNHAAALHALGVALAAQGDEPAARTAFAQAAAAEPGNELYALSHQHSQQSVAKPVPTTSEASTRLSSAPPVTSRRKVQVVSDRTSASGGAEQFVSAAHGSAAARLLHKAAAALETQELDQAQQALEKAMQLEPDNADIPLQAALAAVQCGQPELALRLVNPAVTRHPRSLALRRLQGLILYRQGEYASARAALETAISIERGDALSYFILGHTLERLDQPEAAAEQFARAAQLDPALLQR